MLNLVSQAATLGTLERVCVNGAPCSAIIAAAKEHTALSPAANLTHELGLLA